MRTAPTYGLAGHMKPVAASVPANIAEGHSRGRRTEYRQFVLVAVGSLAELATQVLIANRLNFLAPDDVAAPLRHIDKLRGMLVTLARRLR